MHVVHRTPLVFQDIQADASREVDIWMIDRRLEQHRGRGVWVVGGKGKAELQIQARVGGLGGSDDGGRPGQHVAIIGKGGDTRSRSKHHGHQFRLESVCGIEVSKRADDRDSATKDSSHCLPLCNALRVSLFGAAAQFVGLVHREFSWCRVLNVFIDISHSLKTARTFDLVGAACGDGLMMNVWWLGFDDKEKDSTS